VVIFSFDTSSPGIVHNHNMDNLQIKLYLFLIPTQTSWYDLLISVHYYYHSFLFSCISCGPCIILGASLAYW